MNEIQPAHVHVGPEDLPVLPPPPEILPGQGTPVVRALTHAEAAKSWTDFHKAVEPQPGTVNEHGLLNPLL